MVCDMLTLFLVVHRCEEGQDDVDEEGDINNVAPGYPASCVLALKPEPEGHDQCDVHDQADYVQVPPLLHLVVVHYDPLWHLLLEVLGARALPFGHAAQSAGAVIQVLCDLAD